MGAWGTGLLVGAWGTGLLVGAWGTGLLVGAWEQEAVSGGPHAELVQDQLLLCCVYRRSLLVPDKKAESAEVKANNRLVGARGVAVKISI